MAKFPVFEPVLKNVIEKTQRALQIQDGNLYVMYDNIYLLINTIILIIVK